MPTSKTDFKFKLTGRTLVLIDWANVYGWFKDLGWEIDLQRLFDYLSTYPEIFDKRLYHGVESGVKRSEDFAMRAKSIGFSFVTKEVKFVPVFLGKSHFKKIIKELFDVLDTMKGTNTKIATKLFDIKQQIENRSTYNLIEELDTELKKLNINIVDLQNNLREPVLRRKCDFDCEIVMDTILNIKNFDVLILFSGDGDYKAISEYLLDQQKKVIIVHPFGKRGKEFNKLLERTTNKPFFLAVEKIKDVLIKNLPTDFSVGRDI